ncbi:hypothetical protein G5I_08123 [Acromyrmex echinatior]|uniref:Uncharacterized protein n=1 Tax=Acromyrmex echinatior TaxID=103372 RepID=F4WQN3_ACREC|nr:hypothetical protein G5I_08123 [Acromyrmex echinatior]
MYTVHVMRVGMAEAFIHPNIYGLTKCQRRPSDGKSITKIEAALWWHRGSLSWRASDRNCTGGRPENRAAPSNARSPASRIIYLKTHHAASSLWHCREARETEREAFEKADGRRRIVHHAPRENLVCREDRSSKSDLTASY